MSERSKEKTMETDGPYFTALLKSAAQQELGSLDYISSVTGQDD